MAYLGAHGYPPMDEDMHAIFIASGRKSQNYATKLYKNFPNVELYGFLASVLNIAPAAHDGKIKYK
jgi:hypothetical protein